MDEESTFSLLDIGKIENKWITEGLSEILSTFVLALFIYAPAAQNVLSRGMSSSPTGQALAGGVGLMLAIYGGIRASGASMNPCVTLMFCLTGRLPWKRLPWYSLCNFIGGFIAAVVTYGVYYESINVFDDGTRQIYGPNSTVGIFVAFPAKGISDTSMYFDVFIGCGVLTLGVCMITDKRNAQTHSSVIPIASGLLMYAILMGFGFQTGADINMAIDLPGRLLAVCAGYGLEVFSSRGYWFFFPLIAGPCGTVVFVSAYQLMIGNHLPEDGVTHREQMREDLVDTDTNIKKYAQDVYSIDVSSAINRKKPLQD